MIPDPAQVPRRLTDRTALLRQRDRAMRAGWCDLLHRLAADEIEDRLAEVNRSFTAAAIVSGFPDFWAQQFPQALQLPDDEVLALGQHDLIVHAMALHHANDPVGQIVQCARALHPDGLFIAVMPGGETLAPLRAALAQAEVDLTGGLSPRILPMAELRDAGGLLARGGLALPVADAARHMLSYRNAFHLMAELRAMGEGNALDGRLRHPTRRGVITRAAALYDAANPDPKHPGRVRAELELIFLTGWAPAPTQQQPLRPGSARMPLSAALNARTPT